MVLDASAMHICRHRDVVKHARSFRRHTAVARQQLAMKVKNGGNELQVSCSRGLGGHWHRQEHSKARLRTLHDWLAACPTTAAAVSTTKERIVSKSYRRTIKNHEKLEIPMTNMHHQYVSARTFYQLHEALTFSR